MYGTLIQSKRENLHYQNLLAGSYIQKMRETTDSAISTAPPTSAT